MANGPYVKLFCDQAATYAAFRPTYPTSLFQRIFDFAEPFKRDLALDLGTGQGQAALELAKSFGRVIGMDANVSQLQHAVHSPNVEFREGDAHDTQLPASSVNLVTVAQAFHWFDKGRFYPEVRRILSSDGCLAIWGYGMMHFLNNKRASDIVHDMHAAKLGPYWSERITLVEQQYRGVMPTSADFGVIEHVETEMSHTTNLLKLVGYVQSWSAYSTYCKQGGDGTKLMAEFQNDLLQALNLNSASEDLNMTHPVFMILAKQPKQVPLQPKQVE